MARDIKFIQDKETGDWDIDFSNGDFVTTEGLDTALYLSVLAEKRATEDQVPNPILRRGHFSNIFSNVEGYQIGSLLWLYSQNPITNNLLSLVKSDLENSLSWMIEDNIIKDATIDVNKISNGLNINISISNRTQEESNYYELFIKTFE
jgi:phage gp46-like protein